MQSTYTIIRILFCRARYCEFHSVKYSVWSESAAFLWALKTHLQRNVKNMVCLIRTTCLRLTNAIPVYNMAEKNKNYLSQYYTQMIEAQSLNHAMQNMEWNSTNFNEFLIRRRLFWCLFTWINFIGQLAIIIIVAKHINKISITSQMVHLHFIKILLFNSNSK